MKRMFPLLGLFVAFAIVVYILNLSKKETFVKEFVDSKQEARTIATEDSSYAQRTNGFVPADYNMGPIPGMETPFQVNQFKSYVT